MQDQPLFPGSKITRAESVLLTMGHSLRHSMSKEATESVLKLVEAHLPDGTDFPSTKYSFYKNFFACSKKTRHFYCPCKAYIGELDDATDVITCSDCKKLLQVKYLEKNSLYFYMLDLEEQVRTVLEERGTVPNKFAPSYDVGDITQSAAYHNLPLQPGDLTVTFNTDGVPLYESSGFGIWPLLLQVNELAYKERTQRLLLAGLWFGPKKPIMNCFLLPFVQEMNLLSTQGVLWKDRSGAERTSRVFPGPCTVDTIPRRDVMAIRSLMASMAVHGVSSVVRLFRRAEGTVVHTVPKYLSKRDGPMTLSWKMPTKPRLKRKSPAVASKVSVS